MQHSHAYFANRDCQYFPCHAGADPQAFNCLFCFCPLYRFADCGGEPCYRQGVKDCSNCLFPHNPENYDPLLDKLRNRARQEALASAKS